MTFFPSCIIKRPLLISLATRNAPHNQVLGSIHFGCIMADLRHLKDNTESCSLCWGNPIRQPVQNRTQIIRPTALCNLKSVCYSNSRTCIKCANSVDPAQTPDQMPFARETAFVCRMSDSDRQITSIEMAYYVQVCLHEWLLSDVFLDQE